MPGIWSGGLGSVVEPINPDSLIMSVLNFDSR